MGEYDQEIENTRCLLISSLPGMALRTLVYIARHAERVNPRVLEAEAGKLDIKRRKPGILFISLPTDSLFKLAIIAQLSIFVSIQRHYRRHSKSATSS